MDVAVRLRPLTAGDEPAVRAVHHAVRAPEFEPLGLPAAGLEALLAQQYEARQAGYAAQYPHRVDLVIEAGGEVVGRLVWCDLDAAERRVVDVVVHPRAQRSGVGSAAMAVALDTDRTVTLHVVDGGAARRWYERLGFEVAGPAGADLVRMVWRRYGPGAAPADVS